MLKVNPFNSGVLCKESTWAQSLIKEQRWGMEYTCRAEFAQDIEDFLEWHRENGQRGVSIDTRYIEPTDMDPVWRFTSGI